MRLNAKTSERHGLQMTAHEVILQIPRTAGRFAKASEQGELLPSQLHALHSAEVERRLQQRGRQGDRGAASPRSSSPRSLTPAAAPLTPAAAQAIGAAGVATVEPSDGSTQPQPQPQPPNLHGKLFAAGVSARLAASAPSSPQPPLGLRLWGRAQKEVTSGGDGGDASGGTAFDALRRARRQVLTDEARERLQVLKETTRKEVASARTRADEAADANRWRRCEDALSEALRLADADEGLLSYRSLANLKQGEPVKALADADRAVTVDPTSVRAHYRRARALAGQERHAESGRALVAALALSPRDDPSERHLQTAMTHIRRDRGFYTAGDVVRRGALRKARAARPYSFHAAGDVQRARSTLEAITPLQERWPSDNVDALLVPPTPAPTRPPACEPPTIDPDYVSPASLRVAWTPVSQSHPPVETYVVEMADVDPLFPDSLDFEELYRGPPRCWALVVQGLEPDTEYTLRVYCTSLSGVSDSEASTARVSTLPLPEVASADERMPRGWQRELQGSSELDKLLEKLQRSHGDLKSEAFSEWLLCVEVRRAAASNARCRLGAALHSPLGQKLAALHTHVALHVVSHDNMLHYVIRACAVPV